MALLTNVGDAVYLKLQRKSEVVLLTLAGTYDMKLMLHRAVDCRNPVAWQLMSTYVAPNATVSTVYYSTREDEYLRLEVRETNGGTVDASLIRFAEAPDLGAARPLFLGADTTLSAEQRDRILVLDNEAGFAVTLPPAARTGLFFRAGIATTPTSPNAYRIVCQGDDTFAGLILGSSDQQAKTVKGWDTVDVSSTIELNGGDQGGRRGDYLTFEDIGIGFWRVLGYIQQSGTEKTPFIANP